MALSGNDLRKDRGLVKITDGDYIFTINADGSTNFKSSGFTSIGTDRKVVAAAGTAVQLQNHACKQVAITGETDNTGAIWIGDASVDETPTSQKGIIVYASQTVTLSISNTNLLYIDSAVNGDGVAYAYFN